jgi:hypothetical protein
MIKVQDRLINHLVLHCSFLENPGLLNGKMGIAIFFYEYHRKTNIKFYETLANELIDDVYDNISTTVPINFADGLAGIGWGIEYLAQNKFIDANTDEVLEEFDVLLSQQISNVASGNIGALEELIGLGNYFLRRYLSTANSTSLEMKKKHLFQILDEIDRTLASTKIEGLLNEGLQFSNRQKHIIVNPVSKIGPWNNQNGKFKINWTLSTLLFLLKGLLKEDDFYPKSFSLISRILNLIIQSDSIPDLQIHRILLAMMIKKNENELLRLSSKIEGEIPIKVFSSLFDRLVDGISRRAIQSELQSADFFFAKGFSGVALIYADLFNITGKAIFKEGYKFWLRQALSNLEVENSLSSFTIDNEKTGFGLLHGIAGLAWSLNFFTCDKYQ